MWGVFVAPPLHTTMSYAQPSDLISRFDARVLGDLAEDNGTRVSPSGLLTDPNVQTALNDGAAMIDMACQVGERYTQAQLAALTGTDQAALFRLNCDLAFTYLCQRRGLKPPQYDEAYKRSEEVLTRLKDGALIFNVAGDVGAGVETINFPSTQAYDSVRTIRTATPQFFPTRRLQRASSSSTS